MSGTTKSQKVSRWRRFLGSKKLETKPVVKPLPAEFKLCEVCSVVDYDAAIERRDGPYDGAPHHTSWVSLKAASLQCSICRILQSQLEDSGIALKSGGNTERDYEGVRVIIAQGTISWVCLSQYVWHSLLEYYICCPEESPMSSLIAMRPLSMDPELVEGVSLINKWLKTCSSQHASCIVRSELVAPARLLDLEFADDEVMLTGTLVEGGQWTALSYCWGSGDFRRTTLQDCVYGNGVIRLQELPRLFQDAVRLTRSLGVRYIWIDALCIIQDSPEDWTRESAKMSDIYTGAALTISAEILSSSSEGLLESTARWRFRNPPHVTKVTAFSHKNSTRGDMIYYNEDFDKMPTNTLSTRGWTLQERFLSRRIVTFAEQGIWWECCTTRSNEAWPSQVQRSNWEGKSMLAPIYEILSDTTTNRQVQLKRWYQLVNRYARRSLTFPIDVLPAISGIAKLIQPYSGGDYVAGVFANDAHQGLIWFCTTPGRRRPGYTAPTWSWASLIFNIPASEELEHWPYFSTSRPRADGKETLIPAYSETIATILEMKGEAASFDPFGRVTSAFVRIKGPAVEVCSCRIYGHSCYFDCVDDRMRISGPSDEELSFHILSDCSSQAKNEHSPVLCLGIAHSSKERFSDTRSVYCPALLLRRLGNGSERYERFGLALLTYAIMTNSRWAERIVTIV